MRLMSLFLVVPATLFASDITTTEVGDVASHLVDNAKCSEVLDAIQTVGTAQSKHQEMLNISFYLYSSGYAAGASKPADYVQSEMLSFCLKNPNNKIRDF